MGADEQLGGYSRHRGRFVSSGGDFAAVCEEIELEVGRISERNLGRDNRIVADSGVAPRFPYLDEDVVRYASLSVQCEIIYIPRYLVSSAEGTRARYK